LIVAQFSFSVEEEFELSEGHFESLRGNIACLNFLMFPKDEGLKKKNGIEEDDE
jgi:hypothetical protein